MISKLSRSYLNCERRNCSQQFQGGGRARGNASLLCFLSNPPPHPIPANDVTMFSPVNHPCQHRSIYRHPFQAVSRSGCWVSRSRVMGGIDNDTRAPRPSPRQCRHSCDFPKGWEPSTRSGEWDLSNAVGRSVRFPHLALRGGACSFHWAHCFLISIWGASLTSEVHLCLCVPAVQRC